MNLIVIAKSSPSLLSKQSIFSYDINCTLSMTDNDIISYNIIYIILYYIIYIYYNI